MKKRTEISNPNSCLNRSAEDEELFVLCGRDPATPFAVMAWIQARIALGIDRQSSGKILDAMALVALLLNEGPEAQ